MLKKLLVASLFLSIGTVYGQNAPVPVDPHAPVGDVVNPDGGAPVPHGGQLTQPDTRRPKVDTHAHDAAPITTEKPNPVPVPVDGQNPGDGQIIDPNARPNPPLPETPPAPVH